MYKSADKIREIRGFQIYKSCQILGHVDGQLYVDSNKISDNVDTAVASLKVFGKHLFFDKYNIACVYDLEEHKLYEVGNHRAYISSVNDNTFICIYEGVFYNNRYEWRTGLYNIIENKLINEFEHLRNVSIAHFYNSYEVIAYSKLMVGFNSISILTGVYKWELELSVKHITKIIGCYEDVLNVVYEKENSKTGALGIDAQTGKILCNTEGGNFWSRFGKDNTTIVHFYSSHFSFNGGNLNKFCNIFREVDAKTGEVIREGIHEYLDGLKLRVIAFEIQGSSICFTAQRHFFGATVLGVMDYDTLEVIWWEEIVTPDEKGNNCFIMNNPQMGDNKLYALDSQSTLHIFERTSDEPYKPLKIDWLIPF